MNRHRLYMARARVATVFVVLVPLVAMAACDSVQSGTQRPLSAGSFSARAKGLPARPGVNGAGGPAAFRLRGARSARAGTSSKAAPPRCPSTACAF